MYNCQNFENGAFRSWLKRTPRHCPKLAWWHRNGRVHVLNGPRVLSPSLVQAGLAIYDNYGMWLSHHQKLSSFGQKSSQHIRLDMLNIFVKGISVKIVRRCHTDKHVFGPTINLNSKLGRFISILINLTPKHQFFDPTFMCDCLLVD